jgi:hypothetical protein
MDDFVLLANSYTAALHLRARVDALLNRMGLLRTPK